MAATNENWYRHAGPSSWNFKTLAREVRKSPSEIQVTKLFGFI